MDILQILTDELGIKRRQVEKAVELYDDGNTIPFIARYRKEATGSLDDVQLRALVERLDYLRHFDARREEIRAAIDAFLSALSQANSRRCSCGLKQKETYRTIKSAVLRIWNHGEKRWRSYVHCAVKKWSEYRKEQM